jgi:hypothetical protein
MEVYRLTEAELKDRERCAQRKIIEVMRNPTEAMCDAARPYILGLSIGNNYYRSMKEHLENLGETIPPWMRDKEGGITKWDSAEDIWRLMFDTVSFTENFSGD